VSERARPALGVRRWLWTYLAWWLVAALPTLALPADVVVGAAPVVVASAAAGLAAAAFVRRGGDVARLRAYVVALYLLFAPLSVAVPFAATTAGLARSLLAVGAPYAGAYWLVYGGPYDRTLAWVADRR
jgi:hypothetical protein